MTALCELSRGHAFTESRWQLATRYSLEATLCGRASLSGRLGHPGKAVEKGGRHETGPCRCWWLHLSHCLLVVCGMAVCKLKRSALSALMPAKQQQDDCQDQSRASQTAYYTAYNLGSVKRCGTFGFRVASSGGIRGCRRARCSSCIITHPSRTAAAVERGRSSSIERFCWCDPA